MRYNPARAAAKSGLSAKKSQIQKHKPLRCL